MHLESAEHTFLVLVLVHSESKSIRKRIRSALRVHKCEQNQPTRSYSHS